VERVEGVPLLIFWESAQVDLMLPRTLPPVQAPMRRRPSPRIGSGDGYRSGSRLSLIAISS
jgi:hypothetical protein